MNLWFFTVSCIADLTKTKNILRLAGGTSFSLIKIPHLFMRILFAGTACFLPIELSVDYISLLIDEADFFPSGLSSLFIRCETWPHLNFTFSLGSDEF